MDIKGIMFTHIDKNDDKSVSYILPIPVFHDFGVCFFSVMCLHETVHQVLPPDSAYILLTLIS